MWGKRMKNDKIIKIIRVAKKYYESHMGSEDYCTGRRNFGIYRQQNVKKSEDWDILRSL